jgi:class 3 adenylate cyclase
VRCVARFLTGGRRRSSGVGRSQERGVVGDTPNLAARLQGIAGADSVVIADSTRKLLGDLFELSDLGPQDLKGVGSYQGRLGGALAIGEGDE